MVGLSCFRLVNNNQVSEPRGLDSCSLVTFGVDAGAVQAERLHPSSDKGRNQVSAVAMDSEDARG